jgi:ribosomal subunit interface protein
MNRADQFIVVGVASECHSALPPVRGAVGKGVCCRTVMRVTVCASHRRTLQEDHRSGAGGRSSRRSSKVNPTVRAREICVEIVVTGRNVEVPDHFRVHVADKLTRLERYDHKIVGMEVELFHERNRRQLKNCQRVEITGRGCGPVARAEASAQDFYAALDAAIAKLEARLRRSHDRRRITGRRTRVVAGRESAAAAATAVLDEPATDQVEQLDVDIPGPRDHDEHLAPEDQLPGRIVREKVHNSEPMTVDEALSRMELVGHDFYLFSDAESGQPCVVYRRKGYDYGMITLEK